MIIPTLTTDPTRFGAALDRIERRGQRREARKARWRALRLRLIRFFTRHPGLPS